VIGGWDYTTAYNYSTSKATDTWTAGWSLAPTAADPQQRPHPSLRLQQGAALDELRTALINEPGSRQGRDQRARLPRARELMRSSGPGVAAGGSLRQESSEFISSDSAGCRRAGPRRKHFHGAFGEPQHQRGVRRGERPILKTLEMNAALRYDDYEDDTTNRVRCADAVEGGAVPHRVGKGFRAPSMPSSMPIFYGATGGNATTRSAARSPAARATATRSSSQRAATGAEAREVEELHLRPRVRACAGTFLQRGLLQHQDRQRDRHTGRRADLQQHPGSEAAGLIVRYAQGSTSARTAGRVACPINYGVQT
jgi:hypothetical protein